MNLPKKMLDLLPHHLSPGAHVRQFLLGRPAGGLAESTVRREHQTIGGRVFQAQADPVGDVGSDLRAQDASEEAGRRRRKSDFCSSRGDGAVADGVWLRK